jgi:hypothetical protein
LFCTFVGGVGIRRPALGNGKKIGLQRELVFPGSNGSFPIDASSPEPGDVLAIGGPDRTHARRIEAQPCGDSGREFKHPYTGAQMIPQHPLSIRGNHDHRTRLADGTFASRASVTDKIVLGSNGQFTSSGVVVDYDATGKLLTTGCFTHTATRLTAGFEPHGDEWNH